MSENRPKPDPETIKPQRLAAGLSSLLLFVLWTGSALALMRLPASVAVHYNLQGQPDRYGSPLVMLLMPLLGTLMYFGLGRLARYPHRFNYPRQAGGQDAQQAYRGAVLVMGWIRVLVLLLLCVQVLQFWWASRQPDRALSPLWWLADGAILMAIILLAVLQPFRAGKPGA